MYGAVLNLHNAAQALRSQKNLRCSMLKLAQAIDSSANSHRFTLAFTNAVVYAVYIYNVVVGVTGHLSGFSAGVGMYILFKVARLDRTERTLFSSKFWRR
jgi:hypothetical protein